MTAFVKADECIICEGDLPEGRLLTCCHDCYMEYKARKMLDDRTASGKGRQRPYVCKHCKREFHTKWKRLRGPQLIHMSRNIPQFCSMVCKEGYEKSMKEKAAVVLKKFL